MEAKEKAASSVTSIGAQRPATASKKTQPVPLTERFQIGNFKFQMEATENPTEVGEVRAS
jgi:hypothetical protein